MPSRPLPNLLLQAFFDLGEDGWKDDMDLNLLKLSVLTQAGASEMVSEEPADPAAGTIIVLDETHATHPNAIAVFDDGEWVYFTPTEGWMIYNRDTSTYLSYNATAWVEMATGGGGVEEPTFPAVVTDATAARNVLAADVGKYIRFTSGAAKTLTAQPNATEALPDDGEWHVRNAAAGDLTIVEGAGVTVNPPNGGTLVVPEGGTITLKRVAVDEFDLLGQTVAA